MPSKRPVLFLLLITTLLSVAISLRTQVTYPMPGYQADTIEWATNGRVADTFTPSY